MAVPKKRVSKARRGLRRSHTHVKVLAHAACSHCGEQKLPHHRCSKCGMYNGRQIGRAVTSSQKEDSDTIPSVS